MRSVIAFMVLVCCLQAIAQPPATTQAVGERPPMNVLLLRFDQLDQQAGMQWVGRAVQQSLVAEAVRLKIIQPITPNEETLTTHSTTDQKVAENMGKESGADYVVYGSYQTVENELRFTGSILDVSTGKISGGLKATGAVRDLFGLQDQMADQMKRQLMDFYNPPAMQPVLHAPIVSTQTPLATPVPNSTPTGNFEGSSLQQSLHYKGSIYQTFRSDRNDAVRNNYYYSYPNAGYYYGYGWSGYYTLTPWWGNYGRSPAMVNRGRTSTGLSGW